MGNFIWVDTCGDYYPTAEMSKVFDTLGGSGAFSVGAFGRLSSNGIQCNGSSVSNPQLGKSITARSTVVIGTALNLYTGYPGVEKCLFNLRAGDGTNQVTIGINAAGKITARRGSISGTLLGTSTNSVPTSGYPYIEAKVVINNSTGSVEVRVNGVAELTLTSQDTQAHASDSTVALVNWLLESGASAVALTAQLDDLYIHEDTFQGDLHFGVLTVNANGDNSDFTGSDGNSTDNYLLVDDSTPSESDYVESNTVGHKDLYQTTNLSFGSGTIPVVAIVTYDRKTDASGTTFRHILKSSSTTSNGGTIGPGTVNAFHQTLFHTDPNGGGAHSVSSVNAYQIGQEVLS